MRILSTTPQHLEEGCTPEMKKMLSNGIAMIRSRTTLATCYRSPQRQFEVECNISSDHIDAIIDEFRRDLESDQLLRLALEAEKKDSDYQKLIIAARTPPGKFSEWLLGMRDVVRELKSGDEHSWRKKRTDDELLYTKEQQYWKLMVTLLKTAVRLNELQLSERNVSSRIKFGRMENDATQATTQDKAQGQGFGGSGS